MKRITALFLTLILVFGLVSCKTEPVTGTTATAEFMSDEEAVARYLERLKNGYFDLVKLYHYEDLSAFIELGQYMDLMYPEDSYIAKEVTDEHLDDILVQILLSSTIGDGDYGEVVEGAVQRYDVVTVDFAGSIDGVPTEEASGTDRDVFVGGHLFMPGFEEGLIGVAKGNTVSLDIPVSPYYGDAEMIGKTIHFDITVKKIQRPEIPELTVDLFNAIYGTSFETMEIFREAILALQNEEQAATAYERVIWYLQVMILQNSTIHELPRAELEHYVTHYVDYYAQYLEPGESMEDVCEEYLGVTYEVFMENANAYAQETVKVDLITLLIAEKEEISYTDEQMETLLYGLYEQNYGAYSSMEAFIDEFCEVYGPQYFEMQLLRSLVFDEVYLSAKMEPAA